MDGGEVTQTRLQEKKVLHNLNDRLEAYVLRNQSIAEENDRLRKELGNLRESIEIQVQEVHKEYRVEIKTLKSETTANAAKLAKLETENVTLKAELAARNDRLAELDKLHEKIRLLSDANRAKDEELHAKIAVINKLQVERDEFQAAADRADAKAADAEDRYRKAKASVSTLSAQVKAKATALSADSPDIRAMIEARLAQAHEEWKKNSDEQLSLLESRLKRHYEETTKTVREESESLIGQNRRLQDELARRDQDLQNYNVQVQQLLRNAQDSDQAHKAAVLTMNTRIVKLEKELTNTSQQRIIKENEFNALMDLKISLQAEIDKYRAILEVEEQRTGVTPVKGTKRAEPTADEAAPAPPSSARKHRVSAKRARKSVSSMGLHIHDLDLLEDSVKIQNTTNAPIDMTGWRLKSLTGNLAYNFPEGYILPAGESVTIWSGPHAESRNNPPYNIFWTRRHMWRNDGATALLLDAQGNEYSRFEKHSEGDAPMVDGVDNAEEPAASNASTPESARGSGFLGRFFG